MSKFEGFGPTVHKWFKGLEADNSKEYGVLHGAASAAPTGCSS
jgi:hypothetical protein